jgi:hypothetical protein
MGLLFIMPNHLLIRLGDNALENEPWQELMKDIVSQKIGNPIGTLYHANGGRVVGFFVVTPDENKSLNLIKKQVIDAWMVPPKNKFRSFYFGNGIGPSMNYTKVTGLPLTAYQAAFFDYKRDFNNSATSVSERPDPNCNPDQFRQIGKFLRDGG